MVHLLAPRLNTQNDSLDQTPEPANLFYDLFSTQKPAMPLLVLGLCLIVVIVVDGVISIVRKGCLGLAILRAWH